MTVIDIACATVKARIPVAQGPVGVAISADGSRAYLTHPDAGLISELDGRSRKVIKTMNVGGAPPRVMGFPPHVLALWLLLMAGAQAGGDQAAESHIEFIDIFDAECHQKGGEVRGVENRHPTRAIKVYIDRYFANVRQPGRYVQQLTRKGRDNPRACKSTGMLRGSRAPGYFLNRVRHSVEYFPFRSERGH